MMNALTILPQDSPKMPFSPKPAAFAAMDFCLRGNDERGGGGVRMRFVVFFIPQMGGF
ncbi:MAG: hypothetical protein ACR2P4_01740 [Gammaproteobacteria bacterium]